MDFGLAGGDEPDFDEGVAEGRLAVVDVDPVEMANCLVSIRTELPALIEEFGASRLVLDSVSLLEMVSEDRAKRPNEVYDFTRSLKDAGVTALLTSEASEESPCASRNGIVEIQKIRGVNHSWEKKPYEIPVTGDRISVYQQANLF